MLTSFDHVTIIASDIDVAVGAYERVLGRAPSWRGRHPELGTRGALFGLSNATIELSGPDQNPDQGQNQGDGEGLRIHLRSKGEGLHAMAFGTQDAAACTAGFRLRGLRATEPGAGEARGEDGAVRRYRTVELSTRVTRGLNILAVERPDPAELQRGGAAAAEVDALDHVVIRTSDVHAALVLYGQGLGLRLALDRESGGQRMLFFRIGRVTLEVVEDRSVTGADVLYGVAYRVGDIDAAHARMLASGLATSEVRDGAKPGTRVFTVRDGTCGVPTLIVRDPARD